MYQAYSKLLESSSVVCSCHGHLKNATEDNLVIAKHDILEVYSVKDETSQTMVLDCVYPMSAAVDDMQTVLFPGHSREFLVLAFAEAKLTVLYWDDEENGLKIKSLHLLEEPALANEREPVFETSPTVQLRVDPGGAGRPPQCLVLLVNKRFLFILPFARPVGSLDWGGSSGTAVAPKFPLERPGLIDLQAEMHLTGIRDIAFVDGYFRPTVMVLHEGEQTWSGRLRLALGDEGKIIEKKYLTMAASIVSLTISNGKIDSSHRPIASKLPYNTFSLVPLCYEPFGALILGSNTILHVSQDEQSAYGVHVNAYGKDELSSDPALQLPYGECTLKDSFGTPIPLNVQPGNTQSVPARLVLNLTGAKCVQLPGSEMHYFLALASGDVCGVKIVRNKQNGFVSDIHVRLIEGVMPLPCMPKPSTPMPSCPSPSTLCSLGKYLFVGSSSGDSMLLKRSDDVSKPLTFAKVLTLLNTGPIIDAALGDSSIDAKDQNDDTEVFPTPSLGVSSVVPIHLKSTIDRSFPERHASMEIVAATGRGKDGAVCILNKTVKPFTLCSHMMDSHACFAIRFAVNNKRKRDDDEKVPDSGYHNYLLITTGVSTMVMKAGKELAETDTPLLRQQTVYAASLIKDQVVVQVTKNQVLVCDVHDGLVAKQVTEVESQSLSPEVTVHQACHHETTTTLLMSDGTIRLAAASYVKEGDSNPTLGLDITVPKFPEHPHGFVTSISMCGVPINDPFYFPTADIKGTTTEQTILLTLGWSTGTIQIYNLHNWELLYTYNNMQALPGIATTDMPHNATGDSFIEDVWMGKVDSSDMWYHLAFVTSDDFLHTYRAYVYNGSLRWQKVGNSLVAGRRAEGTGPTVKLNEGPPKLKTRMSNGKVVSVFAETPLQARIQDFSNIFGNEGIFIRTARGGLWGFSERGHIRLHEMARMAPVKSMTPLNITCCKAGFALATANGLKIMQLTWHKRMNFKAPWPTRKILLRSSPHKIAFDGHHRTYTLVVSTEQSFKPTKTAFDSEADAFLTETEAESRMKEVPPTEGVPIPTNGRFELLLYSAYSWKPFTCVVLKENEQVLTFSSIQLTKDPLAALRASMPNLPGLQTQKEVITLQVCGTGFPVAEDIPCRGRIILLRVRVGRTRDDRVLEIEHELQTKGPVTAINASEGHIFAAVAGKIHVYSYEWNKKKLSLVAWCDVKMYTTSLSFMKHYVLVADMYSSVQVLRWSEISRTLTVLAKDTNKTPSTACNFQSEKGTLGMVCCDDYGNITTFCYDPTLSTTLLQPLSDIHINTVVNKMLRLRTFLPPMVGDSDTVQPGNQTALLFGTKGGALCILQSVAESTHRDLHWLYSKMVTDLEHFAGLHPRASRKFKGRRLRRPDPKNRRSVILDMQLLSKFADLPHETQEQLTNAAGFGSRQRAIATLLSLRQEVNYL
eukprot:TRINITY_DN352_c0_g2_i12.p1 TRINITY_DN352_c0_g2~~TRINITY_DN352_c0_g2_i12.p1  ORF type:complete len:1424 (+),score=333.69 TRINITY_DN352_c0_g2_i12:97-4368(+)